MGTGLQSVQLESSGPSLLAASLHPLWASESCQLPANVSSDLRDLGKRHQRLPTRSID